MVLNTQLAKEKQIRQHVKDVITEYQFMVDVMGRLLRVKPLLYRMFVPSIIQAALPFFNRPLVSSHIRRLLLVCRVIGANTDFH
jgi:hypothetical protein